MNKILKQEIRLLQFHPKLKTLSAEIKFQGGLKASFLGGTLEIPLNASKYESTIVLVNFAPVWQRRNC